MFKYCINLHAIFSSCYVAHHRYRILMHNLWNVCSVHTGKHNERCHGESFSTSKYAYILRYFITTYRLHRTLCIFINNIEYIFLYFLVQAALSVADCFLIQRSVVRQPKRTHTPCTLPISLCCDAINARDAVPILLQCHLRMLRYHAYICAASIKRREKKNIAKKSIKKKAHKMK